MDRDEELITGNRRHVILENKKKEQTMKKVILFTIILGLLASFAYAQAGFGGRGPGHGQCDGTGPGMGNRLDCNMQGMGHFGPQGKGMRDSGPREGMILGMAKELNLTDVQIDKIKMAVTNNQMAMVDAKAELEKAQIHLRTLMRDDNASEVQVMDAIDKASMAKAKIAKLRYSHRTEVHGILTDVQRDKLEELRQTRFEGRNKWFGDDDDNDDDNDNNRQFRGRQFRK